MIRTAAVSRRDGGKPAQFGTRKSGMKIGVSALLALAAVALIDHAAEAQQVGTAAAVNPAAQARGSGGARTIVIGQSIAHRERIQTTSAGSVQLLFLDKTSMTIGPNSDLAIDEYVYDPASNTGKLAATLSKGVMRFVGGQISHAGNAQVTTPNAVVGIRGGVGIFQTGSVFIGYGQGEVRSGGATVTLGAGDYTQTVGGGAPPTPPAPPPANFLQSVLASLQSQAGQGGGARATAGQVNNARTVATGSQTGTIATNVQNVTSQTINAANANNTAQSLTQSVQTSNTQTVTERIIATIPRPPQEAQPTELLTGFTAGITRLFTSSGVERGPTFGLATVNRDPANNRTQVNFEFGYGTGQFGSTDPNLPSGNITIPGYYNVVGPTDALAPAVDRNGRPISTSGGVPLADQQGLLVEFRPGTAITRSAQQVLGGTPFCDCEFTRWGFWSANIRHGGGGNTSEIIDAFWVAGRQPDKTDIPTQGVATYVGHAVAQIQNGQSTFASSGAFRNVVNFGTRTGEFTITGLDQSNYRGNIAIDASDPRTFFGYGTTTNEQRAAFLLGSFFRGRTSPIGEMGGGLIVAGSNNYTGAGIFAARRQ
jgi:hypothetical protein